MCQEPSFEEKLAKKEIWLVATIAFFFPVLSYVYTERFKMLPVFVISILSFYVFIAPVKDIKIFAIVVAILDNGSAITSARKELLLRQGSEEQKD